MLGKVGSLVARVAEEAGSVVGLRFGTEEPRYTSEKVIGLEIRNYGPRIAAETTVFGDEDKALSDGFRRLAGYIFGGNHGNAKIAMTAPVARQSGQKIAMTAPVSKTSGADGASVVRFFMPGRVDHGHTARAQRRRGRPRHRSGRNGGRAPLYRRPSVGRRRSAHQ